MSDLISRQAALEAITKYCLKYDLRELLADIECLPTAEKRGEWIPVIDGNYIIWECSECHVESEAWTDYCPICGSRNIEINREAVIDATDEAAYEEALEEFRKNPKTYTLDEVEAELGLTAEPEYEGKGFLEFLWMSLILTKWKAILPCITVKEYRQMDDLISRQAAIELCDWYEHEFSECDYAIKAVTDDLKNLPTAEPRKGKWIIQGDVQTHWYRVTCSECDEDVTSGAPLIGFLPAAKCIWNYCPNCGARMEDSDGKLR